MRQIHSARFNKDSRVRIHLYDALFGAGNFGFGSASDADSGEGTDPFFMDGNAWQSVVFGCAERKPSGASGACAHTSTAFVANYASMQTGWPARRRARKVVEMAVELAPPPAAVRAIIHSPSKPHIDDIDDPCLLMTFGSEADTMSSAFTCKVAATALTVLSFD